MDLREAEDIKKRWQEYTEELYKKDLHDPDNHSGMITGMQSQMSDNIQPCCTPFLIWNQSIVSCVVLTVAS